MLDKMTKWNASFAMILEYKNPLGRGFFFISWLSNECPAFVNMDMNKKEIEIIVQSKK